MKVTEQQITQLTISGAKRNRGLGTLDPIAVALENFGPGSGRITISIYDESWRVMWPAMGPNTIETFFMGAHPDYIAGKMTTRSSMEEVDLDALRKQMRDAIVEKRKEREIDADEARDLWDDVGRFPDDDDTFQKGAVSMHEDDLLNDTLGCDWWDGLPHRTSSHGEYLLDVIEAVQAGLKHRITEAA